MRNWIKRVLLCVMAAVMTVGSLTSCGGTGGFGGNETAENEIVVWHTFGWEPEKTKIEDLVKRYNESQDQYKVKLVYKAKLQEALQADMKSGTPPDVVYFEGYMIQQWAYQGMLEDLTELAARDNVKQEDFYDYIWNESCYDGKLYGIPLTADNRQLFYNKKMFREYGLDPEKPPKTMEELDRYAKIMTKKDETGSRYETMGFIPWAEMGNLVTWGIAFGGQWQDPETGELTPTDPQNIEAMEWVKTYVDEYGLTETSAFANSTSGSDSIFASGNLGMVLTGSWMISLLDKVEGLEYGVTTIPTPDGSPGISWGGGYSFVVPKGSKKLDAAWDFIKYSSVGEGAEAMSEYRSMFPALKRLSEEWVEEEPRYSIFFESMETAVSRPLTPVNDYYMTQVDSAMDKYMRGRGKPEKLLQEVKENIDNRLAEYLQEASSDDEGK